MIKDKIESTFVLRTFLPSPISAICEYLDKNGYPISGCFELSSIGVDDLKSWFTKNPDAIEYLLPFGRGACGDVYAVWLIDGLESENAPIVMFGSDGSLIVLARNSLDFCKLLCLGYSELGLEDHTMVGSDYAEAKPFRDFMLNKFNFELPKNGIRIIVEANKAYPEFSNWVTDNAWD